MENVSEKSNWGATIAKISFLVLTFGMLFTVVYLLRHVLHSIVLAGFFAVILSPVYRRVLRWTRRIFIYNAIQRDKLKHVNPSTARRFENISRWIASLLMVILVFCFIAFPVGYLVLNIARQGASTIPSAERWVREDFPVRIEQFRKEYGEKRYVVKLIQLMGELEIMDEKEKKEINRRFAQKHVDELPVTVPSDKDAKQKIPEEIGGENEQAKSDSEKITLDGQLVNEKNELAPVKETVSIPSPDVSQNAVAVEKTSDASQGKDVQNAVAVENASHASQGKDVQNAGKDAEQPKKMSEEEKEALKQKIAFEKAFRRLSAKFVQIMRSILSQIWQWSLNIVSRLWVTIFNFFIMLFVMFHFFHDGKTIWRYVRRITPLGDEEQHIVTTRIKEVSRAVSYGILGTAIIQACLAMIFFKIVGIPALFWGFMLGLCSLIPLVGTGLIWVPATIYLYLSGNMWQAFFILVTCGCITSNVDSLIRPLLIKQGGNTGMSYLVLFFSVLGGLQTFGLVGVIYGPLIMGICGICLLIFSTRFKAFPNAASIEKKEE